MTEFELHSLINGLYETAQGMVDFWLSVTFAVILARFFGGAVLSPIVLRVIAGLYLAATMLSATRYGIFVTRAAEYRQRLTTDGFDSFYQPSVSLAVVALVVALYLVGTWATIRFLVGAWAPAKT